MPPGLGSLHRTGQQGELMSRGTAGVRGATVRENGRPAARAARALVCLACVGSISRAPAQAPPASFLLDFEGPRSVGSSPESTAIAAFKCRLSPAGVDPGLPGAAGASGWMFGVEAV